MRLDQIVTRGGDGGETSLGDGSRVPKHALRIELLGALDEANAALGVMALHLAGEDLALIRRMQNDLFDFGADLCRPGIDGKRITEEPLLRYEAEAARRNASIAPLRSFVLPGGCAAAAHAHLARAMIRRAERLTAALAAQEPVNPLALKCLNRLSDLMFVLARDLNDHGASDVLWVPGQ